MGEADRGSVVALRTESGLALVVWPDEGRRAAISDGRDLADLSGAERAALYETASPLTVTEGVIELEGEAWLAQQTGPAWAEPAEASADLCGLSFLRLDGSEQREIVSGRAPGRIPAAAELRQLLATSLRNDEETAEDG